MDDSDSKLFEIKVPSSKGGIMYTIAFSADLKYWECSCPAFFFHGKGKHCKHVAALRKELEEFLREG